MKKLCLALMALCFCVSAKQSPNILLIMVDDTGRGFYNTYGSQENLTPQLSRFAQEAVVFNNCESTPICTPSRVKIMTGQHTFANYTQFGRLDKGSLTFAHLLKEQGYRTGVFGKWQLSSDKGSVEDFGFDEHCLHNYLEDKSLGKSRFWEPTLTVNDELKKYPEKAYGPDIINQHLLEFISQKSDKPFLAYYPMVLAHFPFVPTPDSRNLECRDWDSNFRDMVAYTDKLVGKVIDHLKAQGQYDNTLIIFTADNGTYPGLMNTLRNGEQVYGGKSMGNKRDSNWVPLIARLGAQSTGVCDRLVDFTDMLPTLAESAKMDVPAKYDNHGVSFLGDLQGRETIKSYQLAFYPSVSMRIDNASLYVRDKDYKFYPDNYLIDLENDPEELNPIYPHEDNKKTAEVRSKLKLALEKSLLKFPKLKDKWSSIRQAFKGKYIGGWDSDEVKFHKKVRMSQDVTAFVKNKSPRFEIFHRRGYAMAQVDNVRLLKNGKEVARDKHISQSAMAIFDRSPGADYVYFNLKNKCIFDLSFDHYEEVEYTLHYDVLILPVEEYKAVIDIPLGMFLKSEKHKKIENKEGTVLYRSSGAIRVMD
ncbi:sulfatase-like hydrolase/transferase [Lentisphaera marina]|uniref:sulfatase-like hydrolase/transferase n=1 Tax=Lentisphaera marina TaxID=1111041 RepID=UPI002365930C|nr:sulfatase-like hydrolase/transferase [Lentisphaera marina]MDD7985832.1 sulfatase-like hydrolase/transferase [Lentisphaera marina]